MLIGNRLDLYCFVAQYPGQGQTHGQINQSHGELNLPSSQPHFQESRTLTALLVIHLLPLLCCPLVPVMLIPSLTNPPRAISFNCTAPRSLFDWDNFGSNGLYLVSRTTFQPHQHSITSLESAAVTSCVFGIRIRFKVCSVFATRYRLFL